MRTTNAFYFDETTNSNIRISEGLRQAETYGIITTIDSFINDPMLLNVAAGEEIVIRNTAIPNEIAGFLRCYGPSVHEDCETEYTVFTDVSRNYTFYRGEFVLVKGEEPSLRRIERIFDTDLILSNMDTGDMYAVEIEDCYPVQGARGTREFLPLLAMVVGPEPGQRGCVFQDNGTRVVCYGPPYDVRTACGDELGDWQESDNVNSTWNMGDLIPTLRRSRNLKAVHRYVNGRVQPIILLVTKES